MKKEKSKGMSTPGDSEKKVLLVKIKPPPNIDEGKVEKKTQRREVTPVTPEK